MYRELEDVDLLVLPEMALTGYMFESTDDVEPFAEDARHGRTARWAIKLGAPRRSSTLSSRMTELT